MTEGWLDSVSNTKHQHVALKRIQGGEVLCIPSFDRIRLQALKRESDVTCILCQMDDKHCFGAQSALMKYISHKDDRTKSNGQP